MSGQLAVRALDARVSAHLPGPAGLAPYTVIRSRTVQSISTSAAGQNVVLAAGPFSNDTFRGGSNYCQVIGAWGVGTNVPSTGANLISDSIISNFTTGTVSLALHAMTVEVQATGTATTSEGVFYAGTLAGRPYRASYGTFNALATALTGRREMRGSTAYSTLTVPKTLCTFPMDITEWGLMQDFANTDVVTLSNNNAKDTLGMLAIVWLPTSVVVNYAVTISCEWRVIYHNDIQLATTHTAHAATPQSTWAQITDFASSNAGHVLEAGTAAAATLGAMAGPGAAGLGIAARDLGGLARFAQPLLRGGALALMV